MITHEDPTVREAEADGRWARLLGSYRRTRAEIAARAGEQVAVRRTAALGHEIALGAPAPIAAALFDPAAGPGAAAGERDGWVGPLWEVLAARQPWSVLAPLPLPEPVRTLMAHTRVLLGEDLTDQQTAFRPTLAPLTLLPWEQAGWERADRVSAYRADGAATPHFPLPDSREGLGPVRLTTPGPAAAAGPEQPATAALRGLCGWLDARCVRGTAPQAAALFAAAGVPHADATAGYLPFAAAYPALVRAGSGAGAYGRSGGAARGRLAVWRVLAAMVTPSVRPVPPVRQVPPVASALPVASAPAGASGASGPAGRPGPAALPRINAVAALVARMRCFTWCEPADEVWHLHLALEDPATGLAWAVSGSDYD
ncbi:hypothetical protein OG455_07595 [Kitasatospora sp. NBC_01287]|uniref:hypothetical protein n=1 Tax=Kitasatospora sp. NBC_01287 TaxID=2903573 RepID=UPI00224EE12B|nr:hypothetical protein [Kitasatospora sp. NBC_01287]MCX4745387.1 hypothetical protein [Kitasatospora sp. NBC_01287]